MLTLPRISRSSRALIWRDVTYLPSRPDSGDVLTPNVMRRVGASTSRRGSGRGSAGSVSVSPIVTSGRPATDTMSPAEASSISTRSMPCAVWRLVTVPLRVMTRPGSTTPAVSAGSSRTTAIRWPTRIDPFRIRPTAIRPTYSLADRFVTRSWSGWPGSNVGAGVTRTSRSRSGRRSVPGTARSIVAVPSLAFVYTTGNSIWCSSAPRFMKSSYTSSRTILGRASSRSILLSATTTGRRRAIAFWST